MVFHNVYTKYDIEKKKIGRMGNAFGGAFLIGDVASTAISMGLGYLLVYFFGNEKANSVIGDDCFIWMLQLVLSAAVFTLPFIALTPAMNVRVSGVLMLGKPKKGTLLPFVLMGFAVAVVSNQLGAIASNILSFTGIPVEELDLPFNSDGNIYLRLIILLVGAVAPALVEEFALRGIVMGSLKQFGSGFAIITSAVLFGVMHGNLSQMPFAFFLGLYIGYAVIKTGSMWTGIIIHFLNNAFAYLLEFSNTTTLGLNLINIVYFIGSVFLGFVGLLILSRRNIGFALDGEPKTEMSLGEKLYSVFVNPCTIIYFIFTALDITVLSALLR